MFKDTYNSKIKRIILAPISERGENKNQMNLFPFRGQGYKKFIFIFLNQVS